MHLLHKMQPSTMEKQGKGQSLKEGGKEERKGD